MKTVDFLTVAIANAKATDNVRIYSGSWESSGIEQVNDSVAKKIGSVIALLQNAINSNLLCKKDEYLLIYNFQMTQPPYLTLDMMVRPLQLRDKTDDISMGKTVGIVINSITGEVVNTSKCIQELVESKFLPTEDGAQIDLEPPIIYGNHNAFQPLCCFLAFTTLSGQGSTSQVLSQFMRNPKLRQNSRAFDSICDAYEYLKKENGMGKYIFEVAVSKFKVNTLSASELCQRVTNMTIIEPVQSLSMNLSQANICSFFSKEPRARSVTLP